MTTNLNLSSPVFWSTLAGAAAVVVAAIDPGNNLSGPVQAAVAGIGGLWIAITTHHTVKAAVAKKSTTP